MSEQAALVTLSDWMDYLTHDVECSSWLDECEGLVLRTPDGNVSLQVLVQDECLADPKLRKWRDAFVWQLVERYGNEAQVVEITQEGTNQ